MNGTFKSNNVEEKYQQYVKDSIKNFLKDPTKLSLQFDTMCFQYVESTLVEIGYAQSSNREVSDSTVDFHTTYENKCGITIGVEGDCFGYSFIKLYK